jgi:fused signal recognition particle receptor
VTELHPLLLAILAIAGSIAVGGAVAALLAPKGGAARAAGTEPSAPPRATWTSGLAKTRGGMASRLLSAWRESGESEEWLSRVEETLLSSDVGMRATEALVATWRREIGRASSEAEARAVMRDGVRALLGSDSTVPPEQEGPHVILVVGVNGVGKTTTIGKMAHRFRQDGRKVVLVAADTFRAAAIDQLTRWAERVGADLVKHQHGADPSAVVFDGVKAAVSRGADVVIIDTAGRLHVKANLMEEVKKISRTAGREVAGAPHEVLLVIDATTGQNAINQARVFHEALGVQGVVLTKLDGTARGGVALAIRSELGLPIRYVGLGEGPDDLAEFDPEAFAAALFAESDA